MAEPRWPQISGTTSVFEYSSPAITVKRLTSDDYSLSVIKGNFKEIQNTKTKDVFIAQRINNNSGDFSEPWYTELAKVSWRIHNTVISNLNIGHIDWIANPFRKCARGNNQLSGISSIQES